MAPKKTCKPAQKTVLEKPTQEQEVPLKSIGEEDLEGQKDHNDLEGETKHGPLHLGTIGSPFQNE
jgi:hypothetical protein